MSRNTINFASFWRGFSILALFVPLLTAEEPFVAGGKLRILKVAPDGSVTERRSFDIVEARDRAGNRYTAQERPQGKLVTLWLREKSALYSIDFATKKVRLLNSSQTSPGMAGLKSPAPASEAPTLRTVAGVPCVQQPVYAAPNGSCAQVGEVCVSAELGGMHMYSKSSWALEGQQFRNELEITSVQRSTDPDSEWFKLPSGFQVVERQAGVRKP